MTAPESSPAETVREAKRSLNALALEVPEPVWEHHNDCVGSALDALLAEIEALKEALREARAYVYNVSVDHQHRADWRGQTATDVLSRVDAALAGGERA